nr:retrovirus-related Pol polyprotein from transposon TNT 1-94 [Tanacetum cinerariifolium]
MSTEIKLTKDDEADFVDSSKYREAVKHIFRYIRGTSHLGLWYPKGTKIETIVYADSDHESDYVDHKSTSCMCTFMGCCLTSCFAKKQIALVISMTEAEYVSAGKACQQAIWMKQALIDYGIRLDDVLIMCDNKGATDIRRIVTPSFITKNNMLPFFQVVGLESFITLNEPVYPRKFLRALHPKWRAKVTVIKESKDLSLLALEELMGNLKVHKVVMEKDSEIYCGKKERVKSISLKAKKETSNDETLTSRSDDKEYAMELRNFKKFFRRKGKFVRQRRKEKKSF